MTIRWTGVDTILRGMTEYERKVHFAIKQVGLYIAVEMEKYAKENAKWSDRTGNARQSLHTQVHEIAGGVVRVYLSHGVQYGIFLETGHAGRWAIIFPTIEAHLPKIKEMLDGIFK